MEKFIFVYKNCLLTKESENVKDLIVIITESAHFIFVK